MAPRKKTSSRKRKSDPGSAGEFKSDQYRSRRGAPRKIDSVDTTVIEMMPQESPEQVRLIADAYRGTATREAANSVVRKIDRIGEVEMNDPLLPESLREKLRVEGWSKVGNLVSFHCCQEGVDIPELFQSIGELLSRSKESRSQLAVQIRRSYFATAYANVWERLINSGHATWRPTFDEVTEELRRGAKNLRKLGTSPRSAIELEKLLKIGASEYSGNLKVQKRSDRSC